MDIKTKLTLVNRTVMNNKQNRYIVIHYVGAVSSAKANADYFYSVNRQASAHYFVDENEIWQVVKEGDASWHCGTTGTYYSACRNSNSIGIEMCCFNNNGVLDIKESVINKTVELTKELMAKYNIPIENVIRHYDVTHKNCPAPFVNNPNRWYDFKNRLINNPNGLYRSHIQDIGWQGYVGAGEVSGTTGRSLRLEAIQIKSKDIQYRVHMQDKGWGTWCTNNQVAGTTGESRRIEAIEFKSNKKITAQAHVQDIGWQKEVSGTNITIGTTGRSLRLEAFKLKI